MSVLSIRTLDAGNPGPAWPEYSDRPMVAAIASIATIIEDGTVLGRPSVMLSGVAVVADTLLTLELTADAFEVLAGALRGATARWAEQRSAS